MPAATLPAPAAPPSADPRLDAIRDKVLDGERLTLDDGDLLYTTPDIWTVCELADAVRRRLHGDAAYYNINRHFNYSNVCALSCKFCDFYAKRGDSHAYTRSLDDARAEARRAIEAGATEIHIVGGLDPYLPWDYYPDLLRAIRDEAPTLHIKAFTAVEIVHLAKIARVYKQSDRREGIRWVLERLIEAGLGSLPGGGAEVFDDRVHDEAFKGKIRSDVWLDVHRIAHELGLNTNATILYGHVEDRRERLVHMDMLRRAQDEALARMGYEVTKSRSDEVNEPGGSDTITLTRPGTPLPERIAFASPTPSLRHSVTPPLPAGYFQTIIPLPFFPDSSELERLPGPGGLENLRTLAVARLMLDNFPHVKAFWIMQTLAMAQLMLQCGADDIDGTVVWYDITKVGGATTHQETTVWDLQKAIREAGFTPIERDTLYRRLEREANTWRAATP
ncbi:MAG TPA: radical SAM protein [Phycisphaerales bacterium]|nr:radical SAM protein [Phycisphaerales bacterium]